MGGDSTAYMLRFHGLYVFQVTTVSNLNLSCIELELGLGFDNILARNEVMTQ